MFIEFHILQNFAPANLNRDDTNTPKDCVFGGYRRARISSQCIKSAIRKEFPNHIEDLKGIRTKSMYKLVKDELIKSDIDAETIKDVVFDLIGKIYTSISKKDKTSVLLFLDNNEVVSIANKIKDNSENIIEIQEAITSKDKKAADMLKNLVESIKKEYEKEYKERKISVNAPDIALFGRMVADNANLNIDAACQVAHAISTNKVDMEFDYWTAVDDIDIEGEQGAGMLGLAGFNSSCFYRYSVINTDQLLHNLKDDELVKKSINAFLTSSIKAVPTGKQNSFAAQNPPDFIMVVVKDGQAPWSLANAFEKPAYSDKKHSLVENSMKQMNDYWKELIKIYGNDGIKGAFIVSTKELKELDHFKEFATDNCNILWEKTEKLIDLPGAE